MYITILSLVYMAYCTIQHYIGRERTTENTMKLIVWFFFYSMLICLTLSGKYFSGLEGIFAIIVLCSLGLLMAMQIAGKKKG